MNSSAFIVSHLQRNTILRNKINIIDNTVGLTYILQNYYHYSVKLLNETLYGPTPEPWGKLSHTATTYPKTAFASKFQIQVNSFLTFNQDVNPSITSICHY